MYSFVLHVPHWHYIKLTHPNYYPLQIPNIRKSGWRTPVGKWDMDSFFVLRCHILQSWSLKTVYYLYWIVSVGRSLILGFQSSKESNWCCPSIQTYFLKRNSDEYMWTLIYLGSFWHLLFQQQLYKICLCNEYSESLEVGFCVSTATEGDHSLHFSRT